MKARVVVLSHAGETLPALDLLLRRDEVEVVRFEQLLQLEGWLRSYDSGGTPVIAAIVHSRYFEENSQRIIYSSILRVRGIPLLVAGAEREGRDWCEIGKVVKSGLSIFLVTLNLVPELLRTLREGGAAPEPQPARTLNRLQETGCCQELC